MDIVVIFLKFNPFHLNMLATGSDDSSIKIWNLPEGGLKEEMTEECNFTRDIPVKYLTFNSTLFVTE